MRRHFSPFNLRYLWAGELKLLLEQAELQVDALYGTYELDSYTSDSPRLIAVATPRNR